MLEIVYIDDLFQEVGGLCTLESNTYFTTGAF